jgi:predicted dehydrogenase
VDNPATRVALIGTSWWADGAHLPGLRALPGVEVIALCGRDQERAARLAAKWTVPAVYADYRRMLDEAWPDVVVIATPNAEHAPMTLAALDAGAHVICEKPLALDAAQAAQMLARAEERGRRTLTFFTYRGMPAPRYLKRLIDDGYLGRPHHVQAAYLHGSWLDPARPASWKTSRALAGSGVLGDLGAHVIDLLQWWFGPLARVAGSLATFVGERPAPGGGAAAVETDDAAAFVGEFAGGGQATVQLSRVAPERHNYQRIELYGAAGTLVYEYDQPLAHVGRLYGARLGEGQLRALDVPDAEGFAGQDTFPAVYRALVEPFLAGLRGEGPPAQPDFAAGLAAQRVIDAVARAAGTGSWESV